MRGHFSRNIYGVRRGAATLCPYLLGSWVERSGRGGLAWDTLLVGDRLYGYRARLLQSLVGAGWLPVARGETDVRQQVRSLVRLRVRAC
ncbi:MAG: hypothetical protein KatS3mg016_0625 [Fimbriimonadales bacterium]|nr:MAG: hypothetical protein KatS3mg016_0625 [Fimbriimonadales bacterium]